MRHLLLMRQLQTAFGINSEAALNKRLAALRVSGAQQLADGLQNLLQATEASYEQYDRDLQSRTRSLEISSEELMYANQQLRAETVRQQAALETLQSTLQRLTRSTGNAPSGHQNNQDGIPATDGFDDDLLGLTHEIKALVQQREAARDALAGSEERNRRILEGLREVVFHTNASGHWTYLNPAWFEITGFTVAESLGERAISYIHPEDRKNNIHLLEALATREQDHFRQPVRYVTQEGNYRWLEASVKRIENTKGRLAGFSGSLIDITEQKRAQDKLIISEERLNQALVATNSRLWDWDLSQAQPYVDPMWLQNLGYAPDDPAILDMQWDRHVHPDDLIRWNRHLAEHLHRQRAELDIELRFATRSGDWRHASLRGKVVLWRGRRALRMAGMLLDITARKEAEEAVRRQQELTEQILDQLPISVFLKDRSGHYLRFNRQFQILSRRMREDMLGKKLDEFASRRWVEASQVEDELAWQTGQMVTTDRRLTNVDPPIDLQVNRIVIDIGAGESYLLGFSIDISQQRVAQEAMQRAVESAEAASRAKSEFLANMSHEIRTPMNGILGMTELALDTTLTREQREYLSLVKTSADALLIIINDILDFSKIEAGKLDIEEVPFDLHKLVSDTAKSMSLRAHQKNLELVCELPVELPRTMRGDPGRLRQILVNLLGNAIKFTHKGEIVLMVRILSEQDGRCECEFAVHDTGIGIPLEKQQLIFESFSQVDGSTTRQYGGTGLGLTICKRLVILMHGQMHLKSLPGVGSTFSFTVQLKRIGAALDLPAPRLSDSLPPELGLADTPASDQTMRVLLAEDNLVNQRLAIRMFEKLGHRVTLVDNGLAVMAAVTAAAQQAPFDIIFMDLQMPGQDGLCATREIRDWEAGSGGHIPIIAMTARAMQGDRERCLEAGMDDYLSKPIHSGRLRQLLAQYHPAGNTLAMESVLHWRTALLRLDGEAELLLELAEIFLDDGPTLFLRLQEALRRCDLSHAEREVHSLIGVLVNFGAHLAVAQANRLESCLQDGTEPVLALAMAGDLEVALHDVYTALRALIAGGAAAMLQPG
jgi:hypothetical protein